MLNLESDTVWETLQSVSYRVRKAQRSCVKMWVEWIHERLTANVQVALVGVFMGFFREESFLWIFLYQIQEYYTCMLYMRNIYVASLLFRFVLFLIRLIIFILCTPGLNGMPLFCWYFVDLRDWLVDWFFNQLFSYCLEWVIPVEFCRGLSGGMFFGNKFG